MKIVIIGAGVSGLAAGIFSRELGFKTEIYEMNEIPGGQCTGQTRGRYHFDNCINWLTGTDKKTDMYKVWEKVGVLGDNIDIIDFDYFLAANADGQTVYLYKDIEKLREHLLEISIEDKDNINEFIEILSCAKECKIPTKKPIDRMKILDFLEAEKSYDAFGKYQEEYGNITIDDYAKRFKNKAIRKAILSCVPNSSASTVFFLTYGNYVANNRGIPEGGSMAMVKRMEEKYRELGGIIKYNSEVSNIIIESSKAVGIALKNGDEIYGDYIISAVDTKMLLRTLLKNKYEDPLLDGRYENPDDYPLRSSVDVNIGVRCDLSKRNHMEVWDVDPFVIGNDTINSLTFKHYCYEQKFSPKGTSIIKTSIHSNAYDYWSNLKTIGDKKYTLEKERVANEIIKRLEDIYPETKGEVEVCEVKTPVTYERYCGAYKGSWKTFNLTPNGKNTQHHGMIKGINNLYVASQWVMIPGGLPVACLAGKWAVQRLCKDEKIKFDFMY